MVRPKFKSATKSTAASAKAAANAGLELPKPIEFEVIAAPTKDDATSSTVTPTSPPIVYSSGPTTDPATAKQQQKTSPETGSSLPSVTFSTSTSAPSTLSGAVNVTVNSESTLFGRMGAKRTTSNDADGFAIPSVPAKSVNTMSFSDVKITRTVTRDRPSMPGFECAVAESSAANLPPDDLLPDQPMETSAAPVAAALPKPQKPAMKRRIVSIASDEAAPSTSTSKPREDSSDMEMKLRAKLIQTMKLKNPAAAARAEALEKKAQLKKKKEKKKSKKPKSAAEPAEKSKADKKHKKKKKDKKEKKSKKKAEKSDGEVDESDEQMREFDEYEEPQPVRAMHSVIGVAVSSIHRRPPTPPRYDDYDDPWNAPPTVHSAVHPVYREPRTPSPTSRRYEYERHRYRGGGGYHGDHRSRGPDSNSGTGGNTEPLGPRRRLGTGGGGGPAPSGSTEEDRPYAYHAPRYEDFPRPPRGGPRGRTFKISDRSPDRSGERRTSPPPPKDMPEHLRWLHDRWRKYDSNFFKGQDKNSMKSIDCTRVDRRYGSHIITEEARTLRDYYIPSLDHSADQRKKAEANRRRQVAESRHGREIADSRHGRGRDEHDHRGGDPRSSREDGDHNNRAFYHQWRRGGTQHFEIGRMLTFKEWTLAQQHDIKEHADAMDAYNDYKLEYRRRSLARFFQAHSEEEWFLEKYHPMLKQEREARRKFKVDRRLDAFMQLLVRGWMEVPLDVDDARKVRKLVDAMVVILEGGDEGDLSMLNELDYVLEEKKEESYIVGNDKMDADSESEDDEPKVDKDGNPIAGKAPGAPGRTQREQELDEQLKEMGVVTADEHGMVTAADLEAMQHAKDYSLYIHQHEQAGRLAVDLPDNIEPEGPPRETLNIGGGVFVSQLNTLNTKGLQEMNLHRASSVLIRNLAPTVTRRELEDLLTEVHGGFLRVRLLAPDPTSSWTRQAIATFWHNANLTKIIWKLRGLELRGTQIQVIEWREFKRRIELADGLAGDKSVVLRDIQLCKSLIEHLDRRCQLWGSSEQTDADDAEPGEASEGAPSANPLLTNLDECLAFHLHQLLKTKSDEGKEEAEKKKQDDEDADDLIDRDDNLTRVLDRLVLYLRLVHSVDYYGCMWHEHEDDEHRRIGTVTLRAGPKKKATPKRLARYIRQFEERLKDLLPHEKRLAEEHVEVLGKRVYNNEIDKFCENNVISIPDGMSKCCLCYKRFTGRKYAKLHLEEKHDDKIEEVKWIVLCFNNFLSDPTRPCNIEMPSNEVKTEAAE